MVTSLAVDDWAYIGEGHQQIMMSLYKCINCPEYAGDWSWQCFSSWLCEISSSLGECKLFDEGYKGSVVYITLEVLAIVSALILMEKVLGFTLNRDYGFSASLYALAVLMFLLHFLATVLWFGISEASFTSDCGLPSKITERPTLCASTGPTIAVVSVITNWITALTFSLVFYRRDSDKVKIVADQGRLCYLGTRLWMKIVMGLIIANLALLATAISRSSWVKRGSTNSPFTGSLLTCDGCDSQFNYVVSSRQGWDCFAGFICDINSEFGECALYEDLKLAGRVVRRMQYIALSTTAGMLMLLWLQSVFFVVLGREYGFASLNYVRAIQIYAVGSALFQVLAVIIWFSISGAGFNKDCNAAIDDWTTTPEVCSTVGPILAISCSISIGITAILYVAAYYRRGSSLERRALIQYIEMSKEDISQITK